MLNLYEFHWNCGRMGDVKGLFLASPEEVKDIIGQTISFGEILGKHSDISGVVEESEIKLKSDDQDFNKKLFDLFGSRTISGYNPYLYWKDSLEDGD